MWHWTWNWPLEQCVCGGVQVCTQSYAHLYHKFLIRTCWFKFLSLHFCECVSLNKDSFLCLKLSFKSFWCIFSWYLRGWLLVPTQQNTWKDCLRNDFRNVSSGTLNSARSPRITENKPTKIHTCFTYLISLSWSNGMMGLVRRQTVADVGNRKCSSEFSYANSTARCWSRRGSRENTNRQSNFMFAIHLLINLEI